MLFGEVSIAAQKVPAEMASSFQKLSHTGTAGKYTQYLLSIFKDLFSRLHSRFLCPVALVVNSCGDADHNGREEVTRHIEVLFP